MLKEEEEENERKRTRETKQTKRKGEKMRRYVCIGCDRQHDSEAVFLFFDQMNNTHTHVYIYVYIERETRKTQRHQREKYTRGGKSRSQVIDRKQTKEREREENSVQKLVEIEGEMQR